MTKNEALKLALDALEVSKSEDLSRDIFRRKAITAIREALDTPDTPDGWKLVPTSTTVEMDEAGSKAHHKNWDGSPLVTESDTESIYTAMLAAAPEYKACKADKE